MSNKITKWVCTGCPPECQYPCEIKVYGPAQPEINCLFENGENCGDDRVDYNDWIEIESSDIGGG